MGFFVPVKDIFWPIRILSYITPCYWAIGAIDYKLLRDIDGWPGAEPCTPHGESCPNGFTCTANTTSSSCYGYTGEQVPAWLSP